MKKPNDLEIEKGDHTFIVMYGWGNKSLEAINFKNRTDVHTEPCTTIYYDDCFGNCVTTIRGFQKKKDLQSVVNVFITGFDKGIDHQKQESKRKFAELFE